MAALVCSSLSWSFMIIFRKKDIGNSLFTVLFIGRGCRQCRIIVLPLTHLFIYCIVNTYDEKRDLIRVYTSVPNKER